MKKQKKKVLENPFIRYLCKVLYAHGNDVISMPDCIALCVKTLCMTNDVSDLTDFEK